MKTHVATSVELPSGRTCKTVAINYEDALMVIVTDRDNMGTLVEVERETEGEDEDIDVRVLSGAGDRSEAQVELARIIAEILLFGEWTGNQKAKWIKLSRAKKLLISVCLNKDEGVNQDQIVRPESLKVILASIKTLLSENKAFFFD